MTEKNVINAEDIFRPSHGAWKQETDDEMRLAFVCHVFGYDIKNEERIISAIEQMSGELLSIKSEKKGELLLLGCGEDSSQSMDLWCFCRSLTPFIFAANGRPCFVVSAVFNSAMAKCFSWFPSRAFSLTASIKRELAVLNKNGSVAGFLKRHHAPKGDSELSERFFDFMKKQAFSFNFEAPAVEEIVGGKSPYVRAEWFWVNSEAEEIREEYSSLWCFKYLFHEDKTMDDIIKTLESTLDTFREMKASGKVELAYDEGVQEGMVRLVTTDAEIAEKFGFDDEEDDW